MDLKEYKERSSGKLHRIKDLKREFKKVMQNKSFQRFKECISKKPCRIKAFKGLKDEIKEAMDSSQNIKNEFFKVM